eukprot:3899447-Prymnesium_polylepis.1
MELPRVRTRGRHSAARGSARRHGTLRGGGPSAAQHRTHPHLPPSTPAARAVEACSRGFLVGPDERLLDSHLHRLDGGRVGDSIPFTLLVWTPRPGRTARLGA